MNEAMQSVGQFLFDCLQKENITEVFGVPGDYNFTLLDLLEHKPEINFVGCRNELNAGCAADGYARVKGMGAFITTFGVGELNACNAIAGAYSEAVPIIQIVGAPKSTMIKEKRKVHHTLLDGDFDVFRRVYENLTAYTAFITPENAAIEIPLAIHTARQMSRPVYLVIPIDIVNKPIKPTYYTPQPEVTSLSSLTEAMKQILPMISTAQRPVIISGVFSMRYGLQNHVEQLAQKTGASVVTMMMGKGSYDESRPEFIGFYCGRAGSEEVRSAIESSDCILAIGTVWDDYNTGTFTAKLNPLQVIEINPGCVKIGKALYENIRMEDALNEITSSTCLVDPSIRTLAFPYDNCSAPTTALLTAAYYYPRIQQMLRENDIVLAESGTYSNGLTQLRLKKGVTYITQGGWGSIGYATPSAFGACTAAPERRVMLFTGDGALQLTVQEISSMLQNNCHPIIFILNNNGYTIERFINTPSEVKYNDIPSWDYLKLPEAFGSEAFTARTSTEAELDEAITLAEQLQPEKLCIIEIVAQPMDAPELLYKTREILQEGYMRN